MVRTAILPVAAVLASSVASVFAVTPVCSLASASRLAALKTSHQSSASTLGSPTYAYIAEEIFTTYINNYYNFNKQYLLATYGSQSNVSPYWNTAIAIQGLLDYATFHNAYGIGGMGWGSATVVSTVQGIVSTQTGQSGENNSDLTDGYNDDMSWMIHALTKLWSHTNSQTYITMAEHLFDTVKQSDDTSCCGSHPGGVWWDTAHTSKATAAQMGVTVAALKLMETGAATEYTAPEWLSYAEQHYSFWTEYFVNRQTGQVVDHEDTSGNPTWWGFSYNNGLTLGAAVHLYNKTGTASYLSDAALFAGYLVTGTAQTVSVNGQNVQILENDCGGCDGDCSEFHQPAMQYLMDYYNLLYAQINANKNGASQAQIDQVCGVYNFVKSNVDALWNLARNTNTGTVNCNWNAPYSSGTDGLQASMNAALSATSLFASLPIWVN